jgi:hypothetical protein
MSSLHGAICTNPLELDVQRPQRVPTVFSGVPTIRNAFDRGTSCLPSCQQTLSPATVCWPFEVFLLVCIGQLRSRSSTLAVRRRGSDDLIFYTSPRLPFYFGLNVLPTSIETAINLHFSVSSLSPLNRAQSHIMPSEKKSVASCPSASSKVSVCMPGDPPSSERSTKRQSSRRSGPVKQEFSSTEVTWLGYRLFLSSMRIATHVANADHDRDHPHNPEHKFSCLPDVVDGLGFADYTTYRLLSDSELPFTTYTLDANSQRITARQQKLGQYLAGLMLPMQEETCPPGRDVGCMCASTPVNINAQWDPAC